MKAAVVLHAGSLPVYADFDAPPPTPGAQRITVTTAALSAVVKARVSGAHYSASGNFPFIAGIDGVGRTEDGRRVYFILPPAPYGSMAEIATAPDPQCVPLPDGIDDTTAAAIANPGLSSWSALTQRARLVAGETVLINGATGTSGRLAVQVAKRLGAAKVIATARSAARLQTLTALGADETVVLSEDIDALDLAFKKYFASGVDVVLDYLWGRSAERLLVAAKAGPEAVPIRFVQLGNSSGASITLPASAIRSSTVEMMGCGIGSVPLTGIVHAIREVLQAAAEKPFNFPTITAPLSDVERAWAVDGGMPRLVFKIGRTADLGSLETNR